MIRRAHIAVAVLAFTTLVSAQDRIRATDQPADHERFDDAAARDAFEWFRLRDPATNAIPPHIRQQELAFGRTLPSREDAGANPKDHAAHTFATTWNPRGPSNIGGRTRALAVDVTDANTVLAGGVSGGVWRTTSGGASWTRTSSHDGVQGATCIVQDTRVGKQQTWYYGTGEYYGNSAGNQSTIYYGDGIFKSNDGGRSWNVLASTTTGSPFAQDQPFDYVYSLAIDPANRNADVVYAATVGKIMRSSDGGTSWAPAMGASGPSGTFTDVIVTTTGIAYGAISREGGSAQGILRSTDGTHWTNISPPSFPAYTRRIVITRAPSNENIVYALVCLSSQTGSTGHMLWRYTYKSGDGSGTGGTWENLSGNIPSDFDSQNSYDLLVRVQPDNPQIVYIGGVYIYRSFDAFATSFNVDAIGGYSYNFHPDEHALAFAPNNPREMWAGNDGGVFHTVNNLASTVSWSDANNGYVNAQFYSLGIDHGTPGSAALLGGMQDNGSYFTSSSSATTDWVGAGGGDGAFCAVGNGARSLLVSSQNGYVSRLLVDAQGNASSETRVDPVGGSNYMFIAPFALDPNNSNVMYLADGNRVWRNKDLSAIPMNSYNPTPKNWRVLYQASSTAAVSAFGPATTNPTNRVWVGMSNGTVVRLDNVNATDTTKITATSSSGIASGYVNCIAVDPTNGDRALVVYSNYNILSLFYTSDAGKTWTPVGGNLEQNSDGTGSGPSCRWATIMSVAGRPVYFVGTSVGLFSTSSLNGSMTYWLREGATTIGMSIVDMVESRTSDGYVALATHGAGMFSGTVFSIEGSPGQPTLVSPADASTMTPTTATLVWTSVSSNASYEVQVSSTPTFDSLTADLDAVQGATIATPALRNDFTYWWRVRTISAGGASAFTAPWSFHTIPGVPEAPTTVLPLTGATNVPPAPVFSWTAVRDAQRYRLQISQVFSFTSPVYDDSTITDTTASISGLTNGTHYYWRVSAINSYGRGPNSVTASFRVSASAVGEPVHTALAATLHPNHPDPFSAQTTLEFVLPSATGALLEIVDPFGRTVATPAHGRFEAGVHSVEFSRDGLPSGAYFMRLTANGVVATRPMIVLP